MVRSWLFRIASRKVIDAFRVGGRAPLPVAQPDSGPASCPAPDDEALWARVRALPDKQRRAVSLRFVIDLAYAKIGAAMGTTAAAARRNVFEALRTLRRDLRPANDPS